MKNLRAHHFISFLAAGGIALAALNFSGSNTQPLFSNTDNFVLFASEEVMLEQETQVSSGDIGSNKQIDIQKDIIINGNLFADKITLDKNTTINGNVSFNKLQTKKETQILGTQTKPVQLPIANLPEVPDFPTGTQDFKFEGSNNTLAAGSYRDITLEKDSRLVLAGGIYNLRKLDLKENPTIIFATTTILNIKEELKAQQKTLILPGANTIFDDLKINFKGIKPIEFGKRSFLNFKLLAPKAEVHIGQESTIIGQILARKIKIKKDSVLSLEQTGFKIAKPEDIITDPDGGVYPINELLVSLVPDATAVDAQNIAATVNGRVVGNISSINLYQIEIPIGTIQELENLIIILRNNLKVEGVFRNFVIPELIFPIFPIDGAERILGIDTITPAFVKIIITTPYFIILLFIVLFSFFYFLYLKRNRLQNIRIINKLFFSAAHLKWFIVLATTFLLFPLTWVIYWTGWHIGRVASSGIPFFTFGEGLYGVHEFGFSIVGSFFNILFAYILTYGAAYLKRNFRKRGSLIMLLLLIILVAVGLFLTFVRFVVEVSPPFMPRVKPLNVLGFEARAAPQIKYDLENLRNQNSTFAQAYDIIKIQQAWDIIANIGPILSAPIIGIVDFGVEAAHQEFNMPEVNLGSVNRSLLVDFTEGAFFGFFTGGHGTQVTGIIGANNRSRNTTLLSNSPQMNGILSGVLSEDQYTLEFKPISGPKKTVTSTLIQVAGALEAAIGRNSQVVNMSFGLTKCSVLSFFDLNRLRKRCYKTDQEFLDDSKVYQRLFQQATSTLFVAGAGNDDADVSFSLPGALSFLNNVVAVGATDLDNRAGFSDFGSLVDIAAPGVSVYAPAPLRKGNYPPGVDDYDISFSGTSASAPMVTGVAGLIKAIKPELTPEQIKQVIAESGDLLVSTDAAEKPKSLGSMCITNRFLSNFRGCRLNGFNAVCHQSVLGEKCLPDFTLYDDFSTPTIDFSRWMFSEFVRDIRNGKFVSKVRTAGNFSIFNSLALRSPAGVVSIAGRVLPEKLDVPTSGGSSQARLFQKIYNDGSSATPGIGDVVAQISALRSFGASPVVRLALFRCADAPCVNVEILLNTVFPGITPVLGEEMNLGISWDGAKVTFQAGGNTQVIDPSNLAQIASSVPSLPLVFIGTTAFRTDSFASAFFDDIKVNGVLFDDFNQAEINVSKWLQQEFVREVQDGELVLEARTAVGGAITSSLPFRNSENINGIRADVSVSDVGTGFPDNQVARLIGTFYKSVGNESGVGRDGDIIAAMRIIGNESQGLEASFTMFRCLGVQCVSAPHIFTETLGPVALHSANQLLLVWDGSRFFYGLNDTLRIIDPGTFAPVISPAPGFKLLDVQAFSFGTITAKFDNIEITE